jgi:thioredoxin-like negative regulator of GroEL
VSAEIIRLLIAIGLIALGLGGYSLANRAMLKRANRKQLGLEGLRTNTPAILYFTTPYCVPCKTTQRPALERLLETTSERVQLIQVDALEHSELAESWGVLSVPTTFVIDSGGQARRVNHGVASTEKLLEQLEQVEGRSLIQTSSAEIQRRRAGAPGTD